MLYSKNGSIPATITDGTDGWVEVADPPEVPEGKELVWWFPPGWVIRDPKPVRIGFKYSWNQSEERWAEHELPPDEIEPEIIDPVPEEVIPEQVVPVASELASAQIDALTSSDISALE